MMSQGKTGGSLIGRIGSYLQIVSKDPSSTAFVPLAEAYRQTGLLDDALEAVRLGTTRLPHFSPGFATMGRILGQMGRIDEAMSAYAKALSIDRQSQAALVGLARLHLVRGERDQARKILHQAQDFHPDDSKIADMLTALDLPRPWAEIRKVEVAQMAQQDVAAPDGEAVPIPTATLAEVYVKQGLTDKGIKVYREILRLDPGNSVAVERLSQLQGKTVSQPSVEATEEAAPVPAPEKAHHVEEISVVQEPPPSMRKDMSPLAVMQRWLTAIKQGRANV